MYKYPRVPNCREVIVWMAVSALLLLAPSAVFASTYRVLGESDVPYSTIPGTKFGTLEEAQQACDALSSCKAYNSLGELKSCAGCELGSNW